MTGFEWRRRGMEYSGELQSKSTVGVVTKKTILNDVDVAMGGMEYKSTAGLFLPLAVAKNR